MKKLIFIICLFVTGANAIDFSEVDINSKYQLNGTASLTWNLCLLFNDTKKQMGQGVEVDPKCKAIKKLHSQGMFLTEEGILKKDPSFIDNNKRKERLPFTATVIDYFNNLLVSNNK